MARSPSDSANAGDGSLVRLDGAMASPADPGQPGEGWLHGRGSGRRHVVHEAGEPGRGGAGVEGGGCAGLVLANVAKHVDQGVAYLARALQIAGVVAVAPEATLESEKPVHRAGGADAEPTDARDHARVVPGLDH